MMSGGQILNTYEVDNYPGLPGISGFDLGMKLREHADKLGAEFEEDTVTAAELGGEVKKIVCENDTYLARAVIIATGAHHRKLGAKGEEILTGANNRGNRRRRCGNRGCHIFGQNVQQGLPDPQEG